MERQPALLQTAPSTPSLGDPDPNGNAKPSSAINALALVHRIIEMYVALQPHELTTVALWTVYCDVFQRFMIAPRLALISPTHSCGKPTLLDVIEHLLPPNSPPQRQHHAGCDL